MNDNHLAPKAIHEMSGQKRKRCSILAHNAFQLVIPSLPVNLGTACLYRWRCLRNLLCFSFWDCAAFLWRRQKRCLLNLLCFSFWDCAAFLWRHGQCCLRNLLCFSFWDCAAFLWRYPLWEKLIPLCCSFSELTVRHTSSLVLRLRQNPKKKTQRSIYGWLWISKTR